MRFDLIVIQYVLVIAFENYLSHNYFRSLVYGYGDIYLAFLRVRVHIFLDNPGLRVSCVPVECLNSAQVHLEHGFAKYAIREVSLERPEGKEMLSACEHLFSDSFHANLRLHALSG